MILSFVYLFHLNCSRAGPSRPSFGRVNRALPEEIQQSIEAAIPHRSEMVNHAIVLGQQQFSLPRIREKFWSSVSPLLVLKS